jgi:aminopeptidase N
MKKIEVLILSILFTFILNAQSQKFTKYDSLRGSILPERAWYDVLKYDLTVKFDIQNKSIAGKNTMIFENTFFSRSVNTPQWMQIDLQKPMILDSAVFHSKLLSFKRDSNVYWIDFGLPNFTNSIDSIELYYHGSPIKAKNAPWDGGFVYKKDANGKDWVAVACQGLGASVWWPCKDHQTEEPDNGMTITLSYPKDLVGISNGRKIATGANADMAWSKWEVKNPINSYDVTFYLGDYTSWTDTMMGEKGVLNIEYYVLKDNLEKAQKQFQIVKPMLHAFEDWMGPYPFYEDSYKLIDAPYLGMEHQSAVAYGNQYKMGYLGRDRSGTGNGLLFDFIIVHETGHEWYGNSITAKDVADEWIHEGFTTYTETLFAENLFGKNKAWAYVRGQRKNIQNDAPPIGTYGVQSSGSDTYDKASNMIHTIRQVIDNDQLFKQMIRNMNSQYFHQTVTSDEIEKFMTQYSKKDLSKIFDQYLRTSQPPRLEIKKKGKNWLYRWNCNVANFNMPLKTRMGEDWRWIYPKDKWKLFKASPNQSFEVDPNFYIIVEELK